MATKTTNYGLKKPDENDYYNVQDFNGNMDLIDQELKRMGDGVKRLGNLIVVNLPASGWSGSAPYAQTVTVSGVTASDVIGVYPYTPRETASSVIKFRRKLTNMITDIESGDGVVTLWCGEKKPTSDFPVLLRGVSANG